MKKIKHLFLAAALGCVGLHAQAQTAPAIQWQKSLGGSATDQANAIQQTADGGYIVAGFTGSNDGDVKGNHGSYDYWVVKLNSGGDTAWQKSLGGSAADIAYAIQQTADGGYVVAGVSRSNNGDATGNHGQNDCWIVKLSGTGAIQWQKSLGGSGNDFGNSIQQTADGGYIVGGSSDSNDGDVTGTHGGGDYWVVKLNSAGSIIWQKSLGGSSNDYASSIQQTTDGGYIVAGNSSSNNGDVGGHHGGTATNDPSSQDYWVVKLNSTGGIIWQRSLGSSQGDNANSIQQTADGGYIVAGQASFNDGDVTGNHSTATTSYQGADYWIVNLDSNGGILWQKSFGGGGFDEAKSIKQTTDGGYILAGFSNSTDGDATGNDGNHNYWLVKLTNLGGMLWQKRFGGSTYEFAYATQQTADGGYVVAGYSQSTDGDVTGNHGDKDFWVVKLSAQLFQTAPAILWQKTLGGIGYDVAHAVKQTADGGYIVAGESTSTDGDVTPNYGNFHGWIVKLNSNGDTVWQKSLGGTGLQSAFSISQTADGGYIVTGLGGNLVDSTREQDYVVVKLTSTGVIQWQKYLGGSGGDLAYSIQQTTDGGYIVAGVSNSTDGDAKGNQINYRDYWVVKLNGFGGIQWQKNMGVNITVNNYPPSMQQTADGGYIVAGSVDISDPATAGEYNDQNYFVGKLNSAGAIEWKKTFGGTGEDFATSIRQTADGGYVVIGHSNSTDGDVLNGGATGFSWLLKLNNVGGIEWQKSLTETGNYSIQQTFDRGYVVVGGSVVSKLDSTGGLQWNKILGVSGYNYGAESIQQTADSGYIAAGSSYLDSGSLPDINYWVVKLGGTLSTIPTITIATQAGGALCANTAVVFTAALENAGTSPAYQWQKNGVNVGTNSKTYTIAKLNAGDSVTCILTVAGTAYKSNTLKASPIVKPVVSISSSATGGIACAGTAIVFTATATNGGTTPTYQWLKNGMAVGGSNASYTDNSLTTGDTIKVTLTSSAACTSPNVTATSKGLGFKVNAIINPSIYVSDTSQTQCAGDSRGFKAFVLNSGQASYQWYKNNVKVGKNATIYGDKKLNNIDSVWCVLTTKTACATPSSVKSNVSLVRVNPLPIATISGNSCMGSTLTLNINSGIPIAQIAWQRNGVPVANYAHGGYNNFNGTTVATGQLSEPRGICTDNDGNLYIADAGNSRVQKWIPGSTQAITVAGGNGQGGADNQTDYPIGVFVDGDGNLYVADASNHRVQKWAPGASQGVTVAGGNWQGSAANQLNSPWGVYVAPTGEIYVADAGNHRIQKWTPGEGFGVTVAGGNGMGAGVGQLDSPTSVFVDDRGFLYVADAGNNRVQRFNRRADASLDSLAGVTVAGLNAYGLGNLSYAAVLNHPYGICTNGIGGIFVADSYNQRVQDWPTNAQTIDHLPITEARTVAGSDIGIGGNAANQLSYPYGVCFVNKHTDGRGIYGISYATIGSLFITDYANNRVQVYELTDSTNRAYTADSAGAYHAVVTSLYGCTATTKDFVVKPTIALGATVTTNVTSPICAGTKVAFTAAPVDASAKPHYQWYKNSVAVGKNSAVYTDATLKDLDGISVMLTSKAACATPDTVVTDATVFNVNPLPAATSAITGPAKVTANATGVVFSVNNTPGANYIWGVPSGCSIVAGNGTSSITVNWGTQGGKISAQTANGCGLSTPVYKTVSVVATMGNKIGNNSNLVDKAEAATANAFLYPNPAASASKLRLSGFAGGVTVTVATMAGKVVWQQDKLTNGTYTLPLANLAHGMYLVSIKDNTSIRTLRLVKVK